MCKCAILYHFCFDYNYDSTQSYSTFTWNFLISKSLLSAHEFFDGRCLDSPLICSKDIQSTVVSIANVREIIYIASKLLCPFIKLSTFRLRIRLWSQYHGNFRFNAKNKLPTFSKVYDSYSRQYLEIMKTFMQNNHHLVRVYKSH